MSANDKNPPASFDRIEFPFVERTASSEYRKHTHEFPDQDGGAQEKQGRRVWVFAFECELHATMPKYPGLYPGRLNSLREKYSQGTTAELVVPEIGTIRAFITKFQQKRSAKVLSGERVSLTFEEDDLEPFRLAAAPTTRESFDSASEGYFLAAKQAKEEAPDDFEIEEEKRKPQSSLFDLLDSAISAVSAIKDQAELFGNAFASKLAKVTALCKAIHSTVKFLRKPEFHALAREVRRLWDAATALKNDLHRKGPPVIPYIVPMTMSVQAVAIDLYSDARRGGEILKLNSVPNPFAISAGSLLNVYQS
jgi:prophage DNA circulation protein